MSLLLNRMHPHPPGRLWWVEQSPAHKGQDVLILSLRAPMLFGSLACH
ncbi:hypothetical protein [Variovorax paradoxus]